MAPFQRDCFGQFCGIDIKHRPNWPTRYDKTLLAMWLHNWGKMLLYKPRCLCLEASFWIGKAFDRDRERKPSYRQTIVNSSRKFENGEYLLEALSTARENQTSFDLLLFLEEGAIIPKKQSIHLSKITSSINSMDFLCLIFQQTTQK